MKGTIHIECVDTGDGIGMKCKCEMSGVSIVEKAILFKQLATMLEVDPVEMVMIQGILDSDVLDDAEVVHEARAEDFDLAEELKKMRSKGCDATVHAAYVRGPGDFRRLLEALMGGDKR